MKINKLYIRNIASIEEADIDFENGLNDGISGDPASVFLISGDTGTGKSVILDGIALALYKKTPRLDEVNNAKLNEYTSAEGETMKVSSIVQYTRLGIGPDDPCFSEVEFEGNDGETYCARLSLGMMVGRDGAVKHREPKWELKKLNGHYAKTNEKEIEPIIGLDFKQFGRMAMLAQGQFATFLTGKKEDREDILERLTDTGLFSKYGAAIRVIYKKAKRESERQELLYKSQGEHTLTDAEVQTLNDAIGDAQKQRDALDSEIGRIDSRLKLIDAVVKAEEQQAAAKVNKAAVEAFMNEERYKGCKALVADWDSTTDEQRNSLKRLHTARQEQTSTIGALNNIAAQYDLLAADMDFRVRLMQQTEQARDEVRQWLEARRLFQPLMLKADTVDLQLADLQETELKSKALTKEIERKKGEVAEELQKKLDAAAAEAEKTNGEVVKKQQEIDAQQAKLDLLEPAKVDEELNSKTEQLGLVNDISQDLAAWSKAVGKADSEFASIGNDEAKLEGLKKAMDDAEGVYLSRKKEADDAANLLSTMKMSVDDTLVMLRRKMVDEHTETCPLCGQHIAHIQLDDEFRGMLLPLQERQQAAQQNLSEALTKRDTARGVYTGAVSAIQTRTVTLGKERQENERKKGEIDGRALEQGFDITADLAPQLKGRLDTLSAEIVSLKGKQQEANVIQGRIEALRKEKVPLDQAKATADGLKSDAANAVKNNNLLIGQEERLLGEQETKIGLLREDLARQLDAYKADWADDIEATRKKLEDEAKVYNGQAERERNVSEEYGRIVSLMGPIGQIRDAIELAYPKLKERPALEAAEYKCRDISVEWSSLQSNASTAMSKMAQCRQTIADASAVLDAYYMDSGKDEVSFGRLLAQESALVSARALVAETDKKLTQYAGEIDEKQKLIDAAIGELGIQKREELPDGQPLLAEKATLVERRDGYMKAIGDAQGKLTLNKENNTKLQQIEADLKAAKAKSARWGRLDQLFGGSRFRTLVQTYILRPLLNNANIYLAKITDRYQLTCSEENQQLSILVLDRYNKDQVRSVTVLSGGERFMISLALSLALSSLKKSDMNVNILFIDEGFGTLDEKNLDSVMATLEKLQEIPGQKERRVGIISHREELEERIPVKIKVVKRGEGRSQVQIVNS